MFTVQVLADEIAEGMAQTITPNLITVLAKNGLLYMVAIANNRSIRRGICKT